jgi:hypothetical protein
VWGVGVGVWGCVCRDAGVQVYAGMGWEVYQGVRRVSRGVVAQSTEHRA